MGGGLTDIQRAARFFFLQQAGFGGKRVGQTFGTATIHQPGLNLQRIEERLYEASCRLQSAFIEELSWADCITRYDRPHTLFYLDPPYWQTEGYSQGFGWSNYEQIAAKMKSIKGKAILSINAHPDIETLFQGFRQQRVAIKYSVGTAKSAQSQELIVFNW